MARILRRELNLPKSEELAQFALSHLAKCNLLDGYREPPNVEAARVSRRDFARKLGVAAILVPAIMTVVAPSVAMAISCINTNGICTNRPNTGCCPGLVCCGSNGHGNKGKCVTSANC
jgi:hypothetical protein